MRQSISASRPQGQWLVSDDDARWWFDSGSIALDFAYSGAIGARAEWETLHTVSDLAEWVEGRFDEVAAEVSEGDLRDGRALRAAIARAAIAVSRGDEPSASDVDVINLFAATPDIPPVLAGGTRQAGRAKARVGQALSELARDAVLLLSDEERERIRECAASDCSIVFYDESRSNNRRWCSMEHCGNRAKVRAHRAKQKKHEAVALA